MATVVPFASCYTSGVQPLQLFGKGPIQGNYLSLLTYRGPRWTPRPRLACHAPKMTLRQICRMLMIMKQVRKREAAAAAAASPNPKKVCANKVKSKVSNADMLKAIFELKERFSVFEQRIYKNSEDITVVKEEMKALVFKQRRRKTRKQGSAAPAPASPGTKSEKKCAPSCLRQKRSIKRVS
ncbi:hypothetical protein FQN60_017402 [Etheostoma spectabile]|nr:hypothetical protein FQN60_017402 [Etheostoma spectabile]